jgi:23S rRNA G2069 N7-methylase RlmK/C1962 C5-methylase RlmI
MAGTTSAYLDSANSNKHAYNLRKMEIYPGSSDTYPSVIAIDTYKNVLIYQVSDTAITYIKPASSASPADCIFTYKNFLYVAQGSSVYRFQITLSTSSYVQTIISQTKIL